MNKRDIGELMGKTLKSVEKATSYGDDELRFTTMDEEYYLLFHDQGCCESVYLEDITGDLDDLVGSPIIRASEDTNAEDPGPVDRKRHDSYTWTFYNIATAKGHVTLRWYGTSNGYYSESVDFVRVKRYATFEDANKASEELGKDYDIPVLGTKDTGYRIYF